jgi:uncharacterized phage infection (PIP) family protein YhgE
MELFRTIIEFFISPIFYIGYSIILITGFAVLYRRILKPYYQAKACSEMAVKKLREIEGNKSLDRRIQEFNGWIADNSNQPYITSSVKPAWDYFKAKYQHSSNKHLNFAPDVYDFFLEEQFIQKYGKRKFAESVPGIFLAAGIFGTFLSIAVGISALNITGTSEQLKGGIETLLQGMQWKFVSSLVGIALSVVWQFVDRAKAFPVLSKSFQDLRRQLDHTFPTQDESTILLQLLKNEESRANEYRELLQKDVIPEISRSISESLQSSIVPAFEKMQTNILDIQKNGVNEMLKYFIKSLNKMTGNHMKELGETVNKVMEWQERTRKEVDLLVKAIQESSETQMKITEKNNSISKDIVSYADRLEKMVSQFTDVTGKMNIYQSEVANLLDKLTLERDLFHDFYTKHMFNLQSDIDKINSITKHQVEYQSKLEDNLHLMETLSDSQTALSQSLNDQAKSAESMTTSLNETLSTIASHGSTFIRLQTELKDQYKSLADDRKHQDDHYDKVLASINTQSANLEKQVKSLKEIWDSTSHTLSATIRDFSTMNQGLSNTFKQMDSELLRSVHSLSESTDAIRNGVSGLPNIMKDLKRSLDEVNKRAVG